MKPVEQKKKRNYIKLKEGLRIDFTDDKGKCLNYIRFEHTNCEDDTPTYIGSIDFNDTVRLKKLRSVIDALLRKNK